MTRGKFNGKLGTRAAIVNCARSWIGITESPAGSNRGVFWDDYKSLFGEDWQGSYWCCGWVSVIFKVAGCSIGAWVSCPKLLASAKTNNRFISSSKRPSPGDAVFYVKRGTDQDNPFHIGIVEYVSKDGTWLNAIEGNTSSTSMDNGGAVKRVKRYVNNPGQNYFIVGYYKAPCDSPSVGDVVTLTKRRGMFKKPNVKSVRVRVDPKGTKCSVKNLYIRTNGRTWAKRSKRWFKIQGKTGKKFYK